MSRSHNAVKPSRNKIGDVVIMLLVGSICMLVGAFALLNLALVIQHRQQIATANEEFAAQSPVNVVNVDYVRTNTASASSADWMVVTCETTDGRRFNIRQAWDSSQVPLVGERWTLRLEDERCVLSERLQ